MRIPIYYFLLYFVYVAGIQLEVVNAEVEQCHSDCRSPLSFRPVGPTRPWHTMDKLGNTLSLTRPYPYSIAGTPVSVLKFNISMTIHNASFFSQKESDDDDKGSDNKDLSESDKFMLYESRIYMNQIKKTLSQKEYQSFDVNILEEPKSTAVNESTPSDNEKNVEDDDSNSGLKFIAQVEMNVNHNGYNHSSAKSFFMDNLRPVMLDKFDSSFYKNVTFEASTKNEHEYLNRSFALSSDDNDNNDKDKDKEPSFEVVHDLSVDNPNPYKSFCEIGCSIFYSFPNKDDDSNDKNKPVELVHCTDHCDELYKYNISVGYNDLAEVARLECRDGCQMAVQRCKHGYFCSQVKVITDRSSNTTTSSKSEDNKGQRKLTYEGGRMEYCPAGTYRDIDYDAVEECVPCPPGRFREDIKGRNLESCSKCPAGTYNKLYGSSSILDCLRCPAGTFTNQPGSEFCICITPDACIEHQMPSPADAEKRNTIPYIGRW